MSIKVNGFWCSLLRKVWDKLHGSSKGSKPTSASDVNGRHVLPEYTDSMSYTAVFIYTGNIMSI